LPVFEQLLRVEFQSEALTVVLQLLSFYMVFPALSEDYLNMAK
jgi:hypothetical protein